MIGTSGTVTTLGAAHLGLRRYDRRRVDGMSLSAQLIQVVIVRSSSGRGRRRQHPRAGCDRSELIMSVTRQMCRWIWLTASMPVADRGPREDAVRDDEARARRLRGRGGAGVEPLGRDRVLGSVGMGRCAAGVKISPGAALWAPGCRREPNTPDVARSAPM